MIKGKLTKIGSFHEGPHPNGVENGYVKVGHFDENEDMELGKPFRIDNLITSPVRDFVHFGCTEYNNNFIIFNTLNSMYILEYQLINPQ